MKDESRQPFGDTSEFFDKNYYQKKCYYQPCHGEDYVTPHTPPEKKYLVIDVGWLSGYTHSNEKDHIAFVS